MAEPAPTMSQPAAVDSEPAPVIVVTGTSRAADPVTTMAALIVGFHDEGLQVCLSSVGANQGRMLAAVQRLTGATRTYPPWATLGSRSATPAEPNGRPAAPMPVQAATWSQLSRHDGTDVLLVLDPHGLAMPIDAEGATVLDLMETAGSLGLRIGVVLACDATPDTLRQAALVAAALRPVRADLLGSVLAPSEADQRPIPPVAPWAHVVAGQVSAVTGAPVLGGLPDGAASWPPQQFRDRAGAWLPVR